MGAVIRSDLPLALVCLAASAVGATLSMHCKPVGVSHGNRIFDMEKDMVHACEESACIL